MKKKNVQTWSWPQDIAANGMPSISCAFGVWHFLKILSGLSPLWKLCHRTTVLYTNWQVRKGSNSTLFTIDKPCFSFIIFTSWATRPKTARIESFSVSAWFFSKIQRSSSQQFWWFERLLWLLRNGWIAKLVKFPWSHLMTFGVGHSTNVFDASLLQKWFRFWWSFLRYATTSARFLAGIAIVWRCIVTRFIEIQCDVRAMWKEV